MAAPCVRRQAGASGSFDKKIGTADGLRGRFGRRGGDLSLDHDLGRRARGACARLDLLPHLRCGGGGVVEGHAAIAALILRSVALATRLEGWPRTLSFSFPLPFAGRGWPRIARRVSNAFV